MLIYIVVLACLTPVFGFNDTEEIYKTQEGPCRNDTKLFANITEAVLKAKAGKGIYCTYAHYHAVYQYASAFGQKDLTSPTVFTGVMCPLFTLKDDARNEAAKLEIFKIPTYITAQKVNKLFGHRVNKAKEGDQIAKKFEGDETKIIWTNNNDLTLMERCFNGDKTRDWYLLSEKPDLPEKLVLDEINKAIMKNGFKKPEMNKNAFQLKYGGCFPKIAKLDTILK